VTHNDRNVVARVVRCGRQSATPTTQRSLSVVVVGCAGVVATDRAWAKKVLSCTSMQSRHVTVFDFAEMCNARLVNRRTPIPLIDQREFLDRCVALGLLSREQDEHGVVRYTPTDVLARCLPTGEPD
jgi:hypothetical protein